MSKRLIVDLDDTITINSSTDDYKTKKPNIPLIKKLREYNKNGFEIIINTSRNVRTYKGQIGLINANTLPIIIEWLEKNNVPYTEIIVNKPWCGHEGFYIDDKSIRPEEFINKEYEEIIKLISK